MFSPAFCASIINIFTFVIKFLLKVKFFAFINNKVCLGKGDRCGQRSQDIVPFSLLTNWLWTRWTWESCGQNTEYSARWYEVGRIFGVPTRTWRDVRLPYRALVFLLHRLLENNHYIQAIFVRRIGWWYIFSSSGKCDISSKVGWNMAETYASV